MSPICSHASPKSTGYVLDEGEQIKLTRDSEIVDSADWIKWIPITVKKQSQKIEHFAVNALRCIDNEWTIEKIAFDEGGDPGFGGYDFFKTNNDIQVFSDKTGKPLQCKDFQTTHIITYD
jgi:hypothetical protein